MANTHSSGNLNPLGNCVFELSSSLSDLSLLLVPVIPSAVSISAGVSKRPPSAACAIGGRDVVVVAEDDPLGLLPPPHPATKTPIAVTATVALTLRMR